MNHSRDGFDFASRSAPRSLIEPVASPTSTDTFPTKTAMSKSILGIILVVVGAILLAFGFNASESVSDTISEGVTGRYTDKTMWYLIGGAALVVAGGGFAILGRSTSRA